ncbi:MAG TPA: hypothetical protein DCZ92_00810 [Elusimicrobia bacterium]|nr:hypothetical protein [Elusimicrobiota bacterium]
MSKRLFDVVNSILVGALLAPLLTFIAFLVKIDSPGPVFYWSDRVGRNNKVFKMVKFRTMRINTPVVATHLLVNPSVHVTSLGKVLRRISLDELPQLWNILLGNMSFVGPRPALYNQNDLTSSRTARGVHNIPPGLTGWAQVNGRDDLPIPVKVEFDAYYLAHRSFLFDLKIILMTAQQAVLGKGVSH